MSTIINKGFIPRVTPNGKKLKRGLYEYGGEEIIFNTTNGQPLFQSIFNGKLYPIHDLLNEHSPIAPAILEMTELFSYCSVLETVNSFFERMRKPSAVELRRFIRTVALSEGIPRKRKFEEYSKSPIITNPSWRLLNLDTLLKYKFYRLIETNTGLYLQVINLNRIDSNDSIKIFTFHKKDNENKWVLL